MGKETTVALPPGLESDFGWLLSQVFNAYLCAAKTVTADFPGVYRGYLALSAAAHRSARNQIEMSRQLGCDRTVMVYLIDDLVKQGLVERRPDPADRRNRLIVPTEEGLRRLAEVNKALRDVEHDLLAALDPEEQETLRTMLKRVLARRHGQAAAPGPCGPCDAEVPPSTA